VHFCITKLIKVPSINVAAIHPDTRYVLHTTCATLILRTTDALTPTKCVHWSALFGLLPFDSCPLDLKCIYSRQVCVNEIQHFIVSQQSFL